MPRPGLGELLGWHHAEREPGVDEVRRQVLDGCHPTIEEGVEPDGARVRHALVERRERAPVEQVRCVHGVPDLPQLVRERPHPRVSPCTWWNTTTSTMTSSSSNDPTVWNVQ